MNPIRLYFRTLHRAWGEQHWWPAESPFEVICGAILTQNTAWTNVERALANLRNAGKLTAAGIRALPIDELQQLIRPAGYFRQKSARLKTFICFLDENYGGLLDRMFSQPTDALRERLLALNGIGPETADSILLYAGNHEVFVVDAYTRRVFERHDLISAKTTYDAIREMVESALYDEQSKPARGSRPRTGKIASLPTSHPPSAMSTTPRSPVSQRYNEFHGLIVQVGKHFCAKSAPKCEECPLRPYLPVK